MLKVMPDRRMGTKPRYAKAHSKAVADQYQRLGWRLRSEFRAPGVQEPYEYLFEWLGNTKPVYPETGVRDDKA